MLSHFSHAQLFLCDSMDCSLQGSSVHGYSRQEYWSSFPFSLPWDRPNQRIEPTSLMSPEFAGRFLTSSAMLEAPNMPYSIINYSHHIMHYIPITYLFHW